MKKLNPQYIVVHTAAFSGPDCDRDLIDKWHKRKGWDEIGYHYVIVNDKHSTVEDGTVQNGRDISVAGAHVLGLNSKSIGICCAGHGDNEPFTEAQTKSLIKLISKLMDAHEGITVDKIIGHRDINHLVAEGLVSTRFKTKKTCPGKLIDVSSIRDEVRGFRANTVSFTEGRLEEIPDDEQVRMALKALEQARPRFPNAEEYLSEFLAHPEVIELRAQGSEPFKLADKGK